MFWGNSAHSNRVFRMQKKIIRIMTGSTSGDSCRKLFGHLNILPLPSLYVFSILCFVMKNRELFVANNEIHEHDTRQVHNLHLPPANLKKYQSGAFYMSIKLYSCLHPHIKEESNNIIKFESLLKNFYLTTLFIHSMNSTILYKDSPTNTYYYYLHMLHLLICNAFQL
jgi:hypothetical protein